LAFRELGIEVEFKGRGIHEKAFVISCSNSNFHIATGKEVMNVDAKYFRPTEVDLLIDDPTKCNELLGWKPKYDLKVLVSEMRAADVDLFRKEKLLKKSDYSIKNQFE